MKETGLLSIELYWSGSHLSDVCVCVCVPMVLCIKAKERKRERERDERTIGSEPGVSGRNEHAGWITLFMVSPLLTTYTISPIPFFFPFLFIVPLIKIRHNKKKRSSTGTGTHTHTHKYRNETKQTFIDAEKVGDPTTVPAD